MVESHGFEDAEVAAGMGWDVEKAREERERLGLKKKVAGGRDKAGRLRVLAYPGGRHPRIGFLEGAVEPRRETKVSVFTPWEGGGYVVVDVPEAVFCDRGLIWLAHQHIPTVWDQKGLELEKQEWRREGEGVLASRRILPDGVEIAVRIESGRDEVRMRMEVFNGSDKPLKEVRGQVCVMMKGAKGFAGQSEAGVIKEGMWAAKKSAEGSQWVVTGWRPLHRTWNNIAVPCIHSDPWIGEVGVGQSRGAEGMVWFWEGEDVRGEMKRRSRG